MYSVIEMRAFELFSPPHIVTLLLFFITCVVLVYYRQQIAAYKTFIKWTLFSILLGCVISLQFWLVLSGEWNVGHLPLQLCSFSTYLSLYLFLKNNNKVFNFLFFIGFLPPILSMITPDMSHQFPHFRFIRYFLQHSAITLSVLYFILFEGYRVPKSAILSSYVILNIIAVPIFILNLLLGTNFFFLMSPSLESKTLLTFFGSGMMYYIFIEIAAILLLFLSYIPMGWLQKIEKKTMRSGEEIGEIRN
ncbi:TIGR02206 family membrane protein [Peribacillus alkalitolerans]|uniref:YwaF family protein n=1 Tax=Peribacillus alkalitolerans TaxID=1550385 RepID=UPI0013D5DE47|nr:TIGR02206 family membrane protein [Peribacillus alkalitolerans]